MSFALIIQGTSASGKTTAARKIAADKKACYLESDYFVFGIQPFRPLEKEHVALGVQHIWSCFTNVVEAKENIVLEGALVDINSGVDRPFLEKYISHLEKHNYNILRIVLVSTLEEAKKRMTTRVVWDGHTGVVDEQTYRKILAEIEKTVPKTVSRIDTTHMNTDDVVSKIQETVF